MPFVRQSFGACFFEDILVEALWKWYGPIACLIPVIRFIVGEYGSPVFPAGCWENSWACKNASYRLRGWEIKNSMVFNECTCNLHFCRAASRKMVGILLQLWYCCWRVCKCKSIWSYWGIRRRLHVFVVSVTHLKQQILCIYWWKIETTQQKYFAV